jgi:hypothetical protein
MQPSALLASVRPDLAYEPERHVAFDDVFVAREMEPTQACLTAMTQGVGMPDRDTRGWLKLHDEPTSRQCLQNAGVRLAEPGAALASFNEQEASAYPLGEWVWIDVDRRRRGHWLRTLAEVDLSDESAHVGRVGLVGPDGRRLLEAMGLPTHALTQPGTIDTLEVLEEPVTLIRSDFAGPEGYDVIVGQEMFNAVLAVICSWAVRLKLNLLPCGLEAVRQLADQSR